MCKIQLMMAHWLNQQHFTADLMLCDIAWCQLLPAGSAAGSSAGIVFTHGPILRFFAPQGRRVAPIKVKFGREERTVIGSGVGVYGPQNWKKSNFTNIIVPKGRVPCTIFTKFTGYMLVLSLYKAAEFGCFISINDKIINNLLRWGDFSQIFDAP